MSKGDLKTQALNQASLGPGSSARRDFLKFVGIGAGAVALLARQAKLQAADTKAAPAKAGTPAAAATPAAATPAAAAPAASLELVKESDPLPKGLGYVEDATKGDRKDKAGTKASEQHCSNCQFYSKAGEVNKVEVGKCQLFPKGVVASKGWCKSWIKKPG